MSKSKRERMKEKAARHRKVSSSQIKSVPRAIKAEGSIGMQAHLASASPEWKRWYAEVSKHFR
ncbi:hypothetical protein [Cohnella luojiensis]|uniref:Uncharacterized protein n=1 Tax=Cohnella luojiensis TaxID=652876 RepID=A0A4Y8M246_9BACL|nr:hypothetical protein [Cohnella luojiensis]TFE26668.1 hypothetical protein E2980_11165 [Cohnella luojiensis]